MTRWRLSGRCIGGSGREMSSKAMVSFMPGDSSSGSGPAVAERVQQGVADGVVGILRARSSGSGG